MTVPGLVICVCCGRPIHDKFVTTVLEKPWHAECVKCCDCGRLLDQRCFARAHRIYCKEDFYRRFGPRCSGCDDLIHPHDLVRRARGDRVFHLSCFVCNACGKQLNTGDRLYVMPDDTLLCKDDYASAQAHGHNNNREDYDDGDGDMDEDDNNSTNDDNLHPPPPPPPLPPFLPPGCGGGSNNSGGGGHSPSSMLPPPPPHHQHRFPSSHQMPRGPLPPLNLPPLPPASALTGLPPPPPPPPMGSSSSSSVGDGLDSSAQCENHNDSGDESEKRKRCGGGGVSDLDDASGANKRRGPRTTIKAKQLEVLKTAFNQTPKPTRHIREQLAKETGLPMRVIQVWFQNKRSKERRMKQMSGRGKFFLHGHHGAKLRKFGLDDRFYFYDGRPDFGPYGPPPGPPFGPPPPPGSEFYPPGPPGPPLPPGGFPILPGIGGASSEQPLPMSLPTSMAGGGGGGGATPPPMCHSDGRGEEDFGGGGEPFGGGQDEGGSAATDFSILSQEADMVDEADEAFL